MTLNRTIVRTPRRIEGGGTTLTDRHGLNVLNHPCFGRLLCATSGLMHDIKLVFQSRPRRRRGATGDTSNTFLCDGVFGDHTDVEFKAEARPFR